MAVWMRQLNNNVESGSERILENRPGTTDAEWLAIKKASHEENGWTTQSMGPNRFRATKIRWGGIPCERIFRIG